MVQVVIITGCSSGVGLSLAVALAKSKNYKVYATLRDVSKAKDLLAEAKAAGVTEEHLVVKELDVTSDDSVNKAVKEIADAEGKIDVLVNNAGYVVTGTVEFLDINLAKAQFETNYFGVIRAIKAVLPHMRSQKSGRVVNISSVGGIQGVPFNDVYCSSKFALEGLTESMAAVYKALGIHFILIEPGAIVTKFVENAHVTDNDIGAMSPDIAELRTKYSNIMTSAMKGGQTPEEVATAIVQSIEDPTPHLRYQPNPNTAPLIKLKLADPTGDSAVNATYQRFFSS